MIFTGVMVLVPLTLQTLLLPIHILNLLVVLLQLKLLLKTGGVGAGSSANTSRTDYIVVYTPTPGVAFVFYRNSSGGSSLSGNDLYVVEGNSLHLDNNTTNTSGATVDYTVNWGDGSTNDNVANDTADGGADTSAGRLEHRWAEGTSSGTGRDTVTLTLNNHSTATPGTTPTSATLSLKVYDDKPSLILMD